MEEYRLLSCFRATDQEYLPLTVPFVVMEGRVHTSGGCCATLPLGSVCGASTRQMLTCSLVLLLWEHPQQRGPLTYLVRDAHLFVPMIYRLQQTTLRLVV